MATHRLSIMVRASALALSLALVAAIFCAVAFASSLSSAVSVRARAVVVSHAGGSVITDTWSRNLDLSLINGVATAQANLLWHDQRALSPGASETLDLNGTATDTFGQVVRFASVRVLLIENESASQSLLVGGNSSAPWAPFAPVSTGTVLVAPRGLLLITAPVAGWSVSSNTADLINMANPCATDAATLTYRIGVIGTAE